MASVTIDRATKRFGETLALDGVTLSARTGEFLALLGPSGCGKTTLLRLIAGFETLTDGEIRVDGDLLSSARHHVPTEKRRIGMVFQSYALWPHMSVWDNVAFALKVRRLTPAALKARVAEALEMVGLGSLGTRRPAALSGGQRQRVALARCLAMDPRLVLLDEPLANLDAHLRESMRAEFQDFHKRSGATMIHVTHDQSEALTMADRVAVMMGGRLRQVASPTELYRCPADEDVSRFIGRGSVLPVDVREVASCGTCHAILAGQPIRVRRDPARVLPGPGQLCLRAEDVRLDGGAESLPARVTGVRFQGDRREVDLILEAFPEEPLRAWTAWDHALEPGGAVGATVVDGWVFG
ncbi:MAG: ABC transporter ATP-binding protein [Rhodospirillum sp.]|nr:ABC transporter ATP-binding protein [Rhodospirillum sp.]MCF8488484.1 ABC transporter ATP-binding protein [Rhodospirillum sp.]MCF8502094.1 ABC transporter ATP-binding protein [Rhodospirillum sp.]